MSAENIEILVRLFLFHRETGETSCASTFLRRKVAIFPWNEVLFPFFFSLEDFEGLRMPCRKRKALGGRSHGPRDHSEGGGAEVVRVWLPPLLRRSLGWWMGHRLHIFQTQHPATIKSLYLTPRPGAETELLNRTYLPWAIGQSLRAYPLP
jgi:hypothetical protein